MKSSAPKVPPLRDDSEGTAQPLHSTLARKPPRIPDHELLRCIGRGSYGEVWLARNVMRTLRAVKIVQRQTFERDEHFEREFNGIQKFEPVSRSHDGLVDILQIGRNDAERYFYYVMELADSTNSKCRISNAELDSVDEDLHSKFEIRHSELYVPCTLHFEVQRRGRLPVNECLQIGLALAAALEHLHKHGLLHRDIKPSNIIFVEGASKLADIGLVAHIDDARSLVGTAGDIPPEGPGTAQADLYSLGKVLYEISLGKDRQDFPQLPPDLQSHPEHAALLELNEVILKACETDFRKRYQTAAQMHCDLALLSQGRSVIGLHTRAQRLKVAAQIGLVTAAIVVLLASGWLLSPTLNRRPNDPVQRPLTAAQAERVKALCNEGGESVNKQTKGGFTRAVDLFNQAIAIDPTCVRAYLGLADAYRSVSGWHLPPKEAIPPARSAVLRALQLDPKSAEAHAQLGNIKREYDWDWVGAEQEYQRAIALDPGNPLPHAAYVHFLSWMGRLPEARVELAKAQKNMSRSHRFDYDIGLLFFFERRYDQAIEQAQKALAFEPNSGMNHFLLMDCYLKQQRYPEALSAGQALRSLDDAPYIISELGHIHALMGQTNEARQYLEELERLSHQRYVSSYFRGFVHLGLGENGLALDCLETAYEERFPWLGSLNADSFWEALRGEPRFVALLKKLRLKK